MLDEELVARLDASEEVKAEGRSAVLRRAVAEYLDSPPPRNDRLQPKVPCSSWK
jgi:metal-responsive CopG/Arc/MetJ family transcriptional regulator